jgi:hypothetical protein
MDDLIAYRGYTIALRSGQMPNPDARSCRGVGLPECLGPDLHTLTAASLTAAVTCTMIPAIVVASGRPAAPGRGLTMGAVKG